MQFADVEVDTAAHRVSRAGKPVHLGPTEFRLLRYLMLHPGRVFSREQLLDAGLWATMSMSRREPSMFISAACAKPSTSMGPPT